MARQYFGDVPASSSPFVRSAFNYDRDVASIESSLTCEDESLAVQSQAEEADINTIVRRFGLTGQMPANFRVPTFGDFSEVLDFRSALDAVTQARESFGSLPADIRSRFDNDPQAFLEFCDDPANVPELLKLGLAVSREPLPGADGGGVAVSTPGSDPVVPGR